MNRSCQICFCQLSQVSTPNDPKQLSERDQTVETFAESFSSGSLIMMSNGGRIVLLGRIGAE